MDVDDGERKNYTYKKREFQQNHQNTLQAKMTELSLIKEDLKKAKESTTQSWLASRTLTDELAKLQSILAVEKNRKSTSTSNAGISELQSKLEATNMSFRSKMEDEVKVKKTIDEITEAMDGARKEKEMNKRDMEEERRARSKLKQVLRMRKQNLRTLQLKLQAVEMELEAFGASQAEALGVVNNSRTDNSSTVQLTLEEYKDLKEKAKDETALAEWRISLFMKQKLAAEVNRNLALSRLKELMRRRSEDKEKNEDGHITREIGEHQSSPARVVAQVKRRDALPKPRGKATGKLNKNSKTRKIRSRNNKGGKKKKPSILLQVRSFLVRSITRLFR
ncbi:hypothetical protein P3X46_018819 [Hevea brasiliensis]|uniref:Uncharacterized protein n=1 Tax=Hevea brasiliensis TaxID=3981 RepID=A0ABQ9LRV0_HEVBR|nr:uncharacterized protein LOC110656257 [Hevea brasiliensis]KAJ9170731.1 hypothetical protein P3X46_018819 [Hevea brasiliensis]